jgi:MFS family permease
MSAVEARATPARSLPLKHYPWILVGILWMVAFLNAADRHILIAVIPQVRGEFGLTDQEVSWFASVFFWTYAVCAFLFARLGDSSRRSWVIIGGLAFWSVATGLTPLSTGLALLLAFRAIVAVGEATYYPTATALISDWHRPAMRGRALSLHQTAVLAGAGVGAVLAGFIADRMGWRAPFLIFAAIGIVWCVVLLKWLRNAPVSEAAAAVAARKSLFGPLSVVLKRPPALFLCGVFFFGNAASNGVTFWAPTYVHDVHGLDLASSNLYGAFTISIASMCTVPLGGFLADWLAARTPLGRFYTLAIGLVIAGILLLPLMAAASPNAIGLVLVATSAGKGIFDGCIYAAMHDVVPREARASAVGLMTMTGFFGAGAAPPFVAWVASSWGMAVGMTSLAVLYFIAVIIILAIRPITRRYVLKTLAEEEVKPA